MVNQMVNGRVRQMVKDRVKHKPPSRIRYEQNHPVISCRVPKEVYDRFQDMREMTGKSFADILTEGIGIFEMKVEEIIDKVSKDIGEDQFKLGKEEGRKEGRKIELGACEKCGKALLWDFNNKETRTFLADVINKTRVIHSACKSQ